MTNSRIKIYAGLGRTETYANPLTNEMYTGTLRTEWDIFMLFGHHLTRLVHNHRLKTHTTRVHSLQKLCRAAAGKSCANDLKKLERSRGLRTLDTGYQSRSNTKEKHLSVFPLKVDPSPSPPYPRDHC